MNTNNNFNHTNVGAANRQDLFSPNINIKSARSTPSRSADETRKVETSERKNDVERSEVSINQPLELEHMIGYTGHYYNTMMYHPIQENTYISCMGSNVIIGDITDAHNQQFLRFHDEEICSLAISKSGLLIASGQLSSSRIGTKDAPIIIWEYETRNKLYQLDGFCCRITQMSFSPDSYFFAAAGEDSKLIIWDIRTSEVILVRTFPSPITIINWGKVETISRRPKYELIYSFSSQMVVNELKYDISAMQYIMSSYNCALPSSGLIRTYSCSTIAGSVILAGTLTGELVVFDIESKVFRCTIPISSNGVHSITSCGDSGEVYVGSGNGMVTKLVGHNMDWSIASQIRVDGPVMALTLNPDMAELLVGTSNGEAYRLLIGDFSLSPLSSSHTGLVSDCTFSSEFSDIFASISKDGTVRLWDLSHYSVLAKAKETKVGICIQFFQINLSNTAAKFNLITGWEDGCVRAYDGSNCTKLWELPQAHRGAITTIAVGENFFVTGSSDGGVSIWSSSTRELVQQFHEHKRGVTQVLVDIAQSHLIHSCGLDKSVFTYDLKMERRTVCHQVRDGTLQTMTQRKDNERELITGDAGGRIYFWDCDIIDEVDAIIDPNRTKINRLVVSPSGKYLVTASDDCQVKLFDLKTKELIACCQGHSGSIESVIWSPDERQVISVGKDCCMCIWNFYG